MIFNFDLLGLLVLFILIFIYYSKNIASRPQSNIFNGIMITAYIMQLLYIANFIATKASLNIFIFQKLYLVSIILFASLLFSYYFTILIQDKYSSQDSIIDKKLKSLKYSITLINIVTFILTFMLDINLNDNLIFGTSVIFAYGLYFTYIILDAILMIIGRNIISKSNKKNLLIIFITNILLTIMNFIFINATIINFTPVIIIFIIYLGIENIWIKENQRLILEKNYSRKTSLDKVKFLSNLSHEIRNPINVIDGFSQVLIDSNDINSMKEDAKDIRTASKELTEIIDGLIDIATIDNGKLELMPEDYNVNEMFDNIIDISNSRIKDKNIKFTSNIDKDIPEVLFGDQAKLEQILLNIINNSIKYTEKGEINLNVDVVKSRLMCRLKISIKDTGSGMKKEEITNIFNEDKRLENNDSEKLGLIIAKKLLELMNGKIDINSIYGQGTEVSIVIDQKMVSNSEIVKKTRNKSVKPFDSKGKRILIVDDNKLNIKVVYKLLEPYNVKVEEAFSGQECLDLLDKDTNFDLILMDDLMPKMSGTETLDILKKLERIDSFYIPVVVLTANALAGEKSKYLNIGFDDYLAKPIDRYELDRVLRKFIKK